jgi:CheY-like chemotaxis protein
MSEPCDSDTLSDNVLVVDNDKAVCRVIRAIVERAGMTAFAATSPDEAIQALGQDPSSFKLALIDVRTPGLNGPETLEQLRHLCPNLPAIFMTAIDEREVALDFGVPVVTKPFSSVDDLARLIRRMVER